MNGRVLVAYASKLGSTAEIAETIGSELRLHDLDVTVMPADKVSTVRPYEFVIIGSALYGAHWRHPAMRLLRRERRSLMSREVWLFQSGLSVTGPGPWEDPTPSAVAALAREIGTDRPVTFAGALLPETATGVLPRLMARSKDAGDHRDWDRIRAWTREIAAVICARTGDEWNVTPAWHAHH
jgi:menaquinone-dependent protoporphyrinogen oxidase